MDLRYLNQLSEQFPNIASASSEIINLSSILNLPKGTEHFVSDIHGEYEQFLHVLKNGSGAVKRKIEEQFGNTITSREKKELATLIYYPERKLELIEAEEEDIDDWYRVTLHRLILLTRHVSSKYTNSKVRKSMDPSFAYIMEELIQEKEDIEDKEAYYNEIISTMIRISRARECIIAFCNLIQRLVVDHLHVLGDIYDRGPGPHIVMETLLNHHHVDVQWGNHDILWMGAACGNLPCIANVLRISARYGNMEIIEDAYGINMIPLLRFAMEVYNDDPCSCFKSHGAPKTDDPSGYDLDPKMQKAMAIIQFKLEGQLIKAHPEYDMDDRLLLDKINFEKGTIMIDGVEYPMLDMNLPTIDPKNPYELTVQEKFVMDRLQASFLGSEKLQRHINFLFEKGALYHICNNNLMYHGCVPVEEDGSFRALTIDGKQYAGRALYDILDEWTRKGYFSKDPAERAYGQDLMWFQWNHRSSPLFGREKMATFERYFIEDKSTHTEKKNFYYDLVNDEAFVQKLFDEFGLNSPHSHIISGHMPVKMKKGENPLKCGGKLMIIDGGFSKAYQKETGLAGYTLVYNSRGLRLVAHDPFTSAEDAIRTGSDVHSSAIPVEVFSKRQLVADTVTGARLKLSIEELEELLDAYRKGIIKESFDKTDITYTKLV